VSAVTLLTGHLILYVLHAPLDVEPVVANMLSTAINTTIVLAANRRWVWLIDSRVGIRSEIFPFMLIAAAGLVLSTALVWVTARSGGEGLWINAANLAGFGILWLARFAVLDRWVYGRTHAPRSSTNAPTV
jgi:putative flippase GtrA